MEQPNLFYESLEDALKQVVRALGGTKKVGGMLWPALEFEAAKSRLNDCLNTERPAKLSPEELLLLLQLGRQHGAHDAMAFIVSCAGYRMPTALEPKDEAVGLQKQMEMHLQAIGQVMTRWERLVDSAAAMRVVK